MRGALTRWEPFAEIADLRTRFDRVFDQLATGREREWTPAVDVLRDDGNLVVRADIPGIKPEEVKVQIEGDVLTLSGEHEESSEDKGKDFVRRERRYGAFSRSIALPPGIQPDTIEARTHDGVLEVTIPLPEEAKREPVTITPTAA